MTQLEKDLIEIKTDLAAIKKALGIGATSPVNVVDIHRKAMLDAEFLKRKTKQPKKHSLPPPSLFKIGESNA